MCGTGVLQRNLFGDGDQFGLRRVVMNVENLRGDEGIACLAG